MVSYPETSVDPVKPEKPEGGTPRNSWWEYVIVT